MHPIHSFIYYFSLLILPLFFWSSRSIFRRPKKLKYVALSLFLLLGIYSRFIETQIIQIHHSKIDLPNLDKPLTITLIADPQFGVYKGLGFAKKLTKKIQSTNPDYIFMAGDLTYKPTYKQVDSNLQVFQTLENTYAVLGNHDYLHTGSPSDKLSQAITSKLAQLNIPIIDNQSLQTQDFNLLGYGSIWANNFAPPSLADLDPNKPTFSLMHNPDGTYLKRTPKSDLTLAGHTHCGQIRIPFTYKFTFPTDRVYQAGLQDSPSGPLFISCGLGESMFPLRLFNPPRIDVLHLY